MEPKNGVRLVSYYLNKLKIIILKQQNNVEKDI